MLYDPSGIAIDLRAKCAFVLGLWEPVEKLMLLIWNRFLHVFWGPYQHYMSADSRVYKKPDLLRMQSYFAYILNAYPILRSSFHAVIESDRTDDVTKSILVNIVDLCEYYLPLVRVRCVLLSHYVNHCMKSWNAYVTSVDVMFHSMKSCNGHLTDCIIP